MGYQWTEGDEHLQVSFREDTLEVADIEMISKREPANILIDIVDVTAFSKDVPRALGQLHDSLRSKGKAMAIASTNPQINGLGDYVAPTVSEARDLVFFSIAEIALGGLDDA